MSDLNNARLLARYRMWADRLTFDADMRFMDGVYTDVAGRTSRGTFGFI